MATFDDLPAELRNIIYQYALIQDSPIDLSSHTSKSIFKPYLLATSRKIRDEATGIFYGCNIFSAPSTRTALTFLKHLRPESISSIRSLGIFGGFRLSIPARLRERTMEARVKSAHQLLDSCAKSCGRELMDNAILLPSLDDIECRGSGETWLRLKDVEQGDVFL